MNLIILLALLLAEAVSPVKIILSRYAIFAGDPLTVICSVPRHPDNRQIDAVVLGYTASSRQLDGEAAPVTNRFEFKHIPCDVEGVACVLTDSHHETKKAVSNIEIAGCSHD